MNYGELKEAVGAWIDHTDSDVRIPQFIELARNRINRKLRSREMSCPTTAIGDGTKTQFDLPPDWGGARSISVNGTPTTLMTPELFDIFVQGHCGPQVVHCVVGTKLKIWPVVGDGVVIDMIYYRKVPQLVADTDTNWLLLDHSDCWLAGALSQAHGYLTDDGRMMNWQGQFKDMLGEIVKMDRKDRWSGNQLRTRSV